jgi:hypothetical protein
MSGAAAIAAAKNRRGRPDPNKKPLPPTQTCASKSGGGGGGACPTPLKRTATVAAEPPTPVLKITGPTHPLIAIKIHEQRLNVLDERINILAQGSGGSSVSMPATTTMPQTTIAEHTAKIQALEKKIKGLEEMNLKLQQFVNMSIHKMNASLIKLKRAEPAVSEPAVSEPAVTEPPVTEPPVTEPALVSAEPALHALVSEPEPALVSEPEPALVAEPVTMLISELLSTTDYNAVA